MTKRIYNVEENKISFQNTAAKNYYRHYTPQCRIVENGYILPLQKYRTEAGEIYYKGGVTDANKNFVKASENIRQSKSGSMEEAYPFNSQNVNFADTEVLYAGIFINHFGHLLMESFSRLWYFAENSDKNLDIVFLYPKKKKIISAFWELAELLGIDKNKVHFIKEITQFKKIYVPESTHTLNVSYTDKFLIPYQFIASKVAGKGYEKIYLSRTKYNKGTLCLQEEYLEQVFKDNGYKIIYPERLSLKEQIAAIKDVKEIVGVIGTATHLEIFAPSKVKAVILERSDTPITEQSIIHQAKQADWYSVACNLNPFPVEHSDGPILLGITQSFGAYCTAHHLQYNQKKEGYVSAKCSRLFVKEYMRTYVQYAHALNLSAVNSLVGKRIHNLRRGFIPIRARIKQFFKYKRVQ